MNQDEFSAWYDDLRLRLPSLWKWSEELTETAGTLRAWYADVFHGLDFEDCMEVTRQMLLGELPLPYGSELPAKYRKHARQIRFERKQSEQAKETDDGHPHYRGAWNQVTKGSMATAYRKACEIIQEEKAKGATVEEAVATMKGSRANEWRALV